MSNNEYNPITPGNIDLNDRPIVVDTENLMKMLTPTTIPGDYSTLHSMSFEENGKEILVPTVRKGLNRMMTVKEAINWYHKTGEHLGMFETPDAATKYALELHKSQEVQYAKEASRILKASFKDVLGE